MAPSKSLKASPNPTLFQFATKSSASSQNSQSATTEQSPKKAKFKNLSLDTNHELKNQTEIKETKALDDSESTV